MILFTGQKHSHSNTNNVDGETKRRRHDTSKKYRCVCTCCHRKNLMWCDCLIFLKKNYNLDNSNVADALSRRYREVRNKEFICKPCHTKLQHGHFSKVNSNGVDHSENIVVMNSSDTRLSMEFQMTSPDFTQNPTYRNHCGCTCCHKIDLPRSQCITFKASRYNSDNSVISHALSNHFAVSTAKEFICKKCDKSLLNKSCLEYCYTKPGRSAGRTTPNKCNASWDISYGMYLAAILDSSTKGGNFFLFLNN